MAQLNITVDFIARNFPPAVGGAEKLNYDLSQKLKKEINFKVIANKWSKYSPIFYTHSFFKVLVDRKADIIFLSDGVLAPLVPFFKLFKRKPIIIKIHGLDITFNNKLYQFFIPKFINMTAKVICISRATMEECVKRGINPKKCVVIPIGIDADNFKQNDINKIKEELRRELAVKLDDKKIIFSTGALVKRKGAFWFIKEVIPALLKVRKDFVYLVAGGVLHKGQIKDYRYKEQIENVIVREHLENYVSILGKVSDKNLNWLYQAADIFVMPNIPVKGDMEGFGIVALEAASYGLPVIASNMEGIKDAIINNRNGFLVNSGDPKGFIEVINKLLENDRTREEFGAKAKSYTIEHYKWSSIIQRYLKEFESLTKNK